MCISLRLLCGACDPPCLSLALASVNDSGHSVISYHSYSQSREFSRAHRIHCQRTCKLRTVFQISHFFFVDSMVMWNSKWYHIPILLFTGYIWTGFSRVTVSNFFTFPKEKQMREWPWEISPAQCEEPGMCHARKQRPSTGNAAVTQQALWYGKQILCFLSTIKLCGKHMDFTINFQM